MYSFSYKFEIFFLCNYINHTFFIYCKVLIQYPQVSTVIFWLIVHFIIMKYFPLSCWTYFIFWLHRWYQVLIPHCTWGFETWLFSLCRCWGLSHYEFFRQQALHRSSVFKSDLLIYIHFLFLAARHLDTLFSFSDIKNSIYIIICMSTNPLFKYFYIYIHILYIYIHTHTHTHTHIYLYTKQEEMHTCMCNIYRRRSAQKNRCINMCFFCHLDLEFYLIFS